jgi:hypothetical protein
MERQYSRLQTILDVPLIRRIRRNHGLEHATIHLLSRQIPDLRMVGRSDWDGFWLHGNVPTEDVEQSVNRALERMQGGEHQLAIHPNCGTNLVTMALLGTAVVLTALVGSERKRFGRLERIPLMVVGLMGAVLFGQSLGLQLQKHVTTSGDPGDLEVVEIRRVEHGNLISHRVETRSS